MKNINLFFVTLLFQILCLHSNIGQVSKVQGLFYLDMEPITIEIKGETIHRIERPKTLQKTENLSIIAPGFIDHQVNGYLSHSFTGEDLTMAQIKEITGIFWKHGITTYLPTLTSHQTDRLLKNFRILAQASKDEEIGPSIPGFHLEGPYISPIDGFRGAHHSRHIRPPDWNEFSQFQLAAENKIIEITVAPELESAIEFIKKCTASGVIVALGHHNGSTEEIQSAVTAGATISTHLGNGCANTIHRHHNPLWPQLAEDRLAASIILDGFHLLPEEVQTFYKVKGLHNTILVSDVTSMAGLPPGKYRNFDAEVVVTEEGKVMMPTQNVLAGASFLIDRGIENMISYTGCSLADAIQMASANVARMLGLKDRGEIQLGKRADLVLFTFENNKIAVQKTVLAGKLVYEAKQ